MSIEQQVDQFLWVERYRPKKVVDTILPDDLKKTFQQFVDSGNIPNLMLSGGPGTGKTTVAKAMCNELNIDYLVINASMNGGIDTLRTEIMRFASTVSIVADGRKMVILDEADHLPPLTQASLRNFMEEFSKNCGFILTCNFKNRLIQPLHSRCSVIEFKIGANDKAKIAGQFMKRTQEILSKENIEYDPKVVAAVIMKHFPDWRRVLNELQRYSATGKIDSGILVNMSDESFKGLVDLVKNKKWKEMRKWVGENQDTDPSALMRKFYDEAFEYVKPSSVPTLVLLIADYQYKINFVADAEVCLVAFLTQVMTEVEFV
jgi:DNA polymerase III delta prime subunit